MRGYSRPALLWLAIVALLPSAAAAQAGLAETWYASDAAGFRSGEIPGPEGRDWALLVAQKPGYERSTLYADGTPGKSWTREWSPGGILERMALEDGGTIVEETIHDSLGRPSVERRFADGGGIEEIAYSYDSGRLASKTTTIEGRVTGTVEYLYAPDGRLASARDSAGVSWGTGSAKVGLSYGWRTSPAGVEVRGHDRAGRLVSIDTYAGAERVSSELRTWDGAALERSVLVKGDGTTTTDFVTRGPAEGQALFVTVEKGGVVSTLERRWYDDAGRLFRTEAEKSGHVSVAEYLYGEDGALVEERRLVDSQLSAVITHTAPGVRVEEAWDKGKLFARVTWKDGRKVLEELIKDGVVVRSKAYE